MPSSWEDIETKLVDTIKAKYSELGYTNNLEAKVHTYLPEHEHSAKRYEYFLADVGETSKKVRAWYVYVSQSLDFETFNTTSIDLDIQIGAFYEKGVGGLGLSLLKQHLSVVQQAIRDLESNLDGTVRNIIDWSFPVITPVSVNVSNYEGEVLEAIFTISAVKPGGTI